LHHELLDLSALRRLQLMLYGALIFLFAGLCHISFIPCSVWLCRGLLRHITLGLSKGTAGASLDEMFRRIMVLLLSMSSLTQLFLWHVVDFGAADFSSLIEKSHNSSSWKGGLTCVLLCDTSWWF